MGSCKKPKSREQVIGVDPDLAPLVAELWDDGELWACFSPEEKVLMCETAREYFRRQNYARLDLQDALNRYREMLEAANEYEDWKRDAGRA